MISLFHNQCSTIKGTLCRIYQNLKSQTEYIFIKILLVCNYRLTITNKQ